MHEWIDFFYLKLSQMKIFISEARVRSLVIPSRHHNASSIWASVQGNNEVGLWNLESQYRQLVLWPSASPLLAGTSGNSDFMSSLFSIQNHDTNVLLTAGTDMRIRYWDLQNTQSSFIVCGAGSETVNPAAVSYRVKVVDGTEVVQEVHDKPKTASGGAASGGKKESTKDAQAQNKPDAPSYGHLNWISSLTLCQATNWYVVSGSRDGVIKVWR